MKREKPPLPILEKTVRGLIPAAAFDAEALESFPVGTQFDLVARTKRSDKQLRTYWKALGGVVKATGQWPTPEHLHDELKLALGYARIAVNWNTGEAVSIPDSVAINAMDHETFKAFMARAMALLSERAGFDVLAWLDQ